MSIVHSVAVDPIEHRLFVADRENGRILIFHTDSGLFIQEIKAPTGAVYAVAYNPMKGIYLYIIHPLLSFSSACYACWTTAWASIGSLCVIRISNSTHI